MSGVSGVSGFTFSEFISFPISAQWNFANSVKPCGKCAKHQYWIFVRGDSPVRLLLLMGWAILDQRPIYKGRVLKARILAEGSHIEEIVATLGALGWRIR